MGYMKTVAIAFTTLTTSFVVGSFGFNIAAQAVRLSDGKIYFEAVPQLTDATITRQSVSDSNVKYYFELSVPTDAGEPLQRLDITQQNGSSLTREVEFELDRSAAFVGRRRDREDDLSVSSTRFNEDTQTTTIVFDPPIAPGTNFTLQLRAERNPRQAGVYLFGVTAFPNGDVAHGQFLGFGRFHIYDNRSRFPR